MSSSSIASVSAWFVEMPLTKAYKVSYGVVTHTQVVLVRVRTADGLEGWGEAAPLRGFTADCAQGVLATLRAVLAPLVLGLDALNRNAVHAALSAIPGNHMAKGALDMALWDIAGKALKVPVAHLLGGALRTEVDILWPVGDQTPQEDVKQLEERYAQGYRTFMLKMGGSDDIKKDIERVRRVNANFKDRGGVFLNVDANNGWSLEQATAFAAGVRDEPLMFIEQPLHVGRHWEVKALRARTAHRLSADEDIQTASDARHLCEEHLYDVFSLKVSKNGGITETMEMAKLAELFGVKVMYNSMLEMGVAQAALLHLACATRNLVAGGHCLFSTLRLADDVTDFAETCCKDGVARLSDRPGLGIQVDMDRVRKYAQDQFELTHDAAAAAK